MGVDGNDVEASRLRAQLARETSSTDPVAWLVAHAEGDLDMLLADRMFLHGVRDSLGHDQAEAERLAREAREARRDLVLHLNRDLHLPVRDIAVIMGLSHQRVSAMMKEPDQTG